MKRIIRIFAAASALMALGTAVAQADPILVDPTDDTSSATVTINDSVCLPSCYAGTVLSPDLGSEQAWLDVGQSFTFDFFDLFVGGFGLVANATVEATLGFVSPESLATASGQGSFFTLFGILSGGSLQWNQPSDIALDDGTWLNVEFSDIHDLGFGNSTTVSATVGRYGTVRPVPEPGVLGLFGLGLLGLGFAARARGQRVAA